MQLFEQILSCYGWEGAALAGATLLMLGVQLYYYIFVYGRIPGYKNNRRPQTMDREPPVSVVVPLFSEDYSFVEERLPLILAQNYPDFEVVIVYVGHDSDFYEDLVRLKQSFPQITTTKIHLDPRFPISRKMALNVGIKSAHYECMVFTSTDAVPQTDRWLSLMAKGFMRGEIVVGYCGVERGKGFSNYMMRAWRMMHSADWIARAVQRRAYRGTLHNYGFTKSLCFGANGFSHLNMNIGEDDLFMQRVMSRDNVSVILSPRASLREKNVGGMGWWMSQLRYFGSAFRFYPRAVKTFVRWRSVRGCSFRHGGLRPCGHASRVQARRAAARRHPLCRRGVRSAASRGGWARAALQGVTSSTTCSARCGPRRWGRCCSAVTTAYGDSRLYRSRRP